MRRFQLVRHEDISGVSGTGMVAEGVQFTNGAVAVCWHSNGIYPTLVMHQSVESVEAIHCHGGTTEIRYLDPEQVPPQEGVTPPIPIDLPPVEGEALADPEPELLEDISDEVPY